MSDRRCPIAVDPRLVGDPVDTLTGAVTDRQLDFRLTGPVELRWMRFYDSGLADRMLGMGRGWSHSYDHALRIEDDGFVLEEPGGAEQRYPRVDGIASRAVTPLSTSEFALRRSDGTTMTFVRSSESRRARLVRLGAGGHDIRFDRDCEGRLRCIVDAIGRHIDVETAGDGRVERLSSANGAGGHTLMAYRYDEQGLLVATSNHLGHGHAYDYDDVGRMVRRVGRRGFTFQFRYDDQGRCVLSMGEGRLYGVAVEYAVPGRLTRVRRPDGGLWTYVFDTRRALAEVRDPLGGVQRFVMDQRGRRTLDFDANGNATRIVHDAAGLPVATVDPLGHRRVLPEDPNEADPLAQRVPSNAIEYVFGRLLPLSSAQLPRPGDPRLDALPTEHHALVAWQSADPVAPADRHPAQPLSLRWWPEPRRGHVFNAFGKLIAQRDMRGRERQWTYDESGNEREHVDFDGSHWLYHYGGWHFLLGTTSPLGARVEYGYTVYGHVAFAVDAGGTRSEYRYDLKEQLVEVHRDGSLRERYVLDAVGNLVAKHARDGRLLLHVEIGAGNLPVRRTVAGAGDQALRYDRCGRLVSADHDAARIVFEYDADGNATLEQRDGAGMERRFRAGRLLAEQRVFGRYATIYCWQGSTLFITDPTGGVHAVSFPADGIVQRVDANGTQETQQFDDLGRCVFKVAEQSGRRRWTRRFSWSGEGELRQVHDSASGETVHEYDAAHRLARRLRDGAVETFVFDEADNLLEQPGLADVALGRANRLGRANGETFEYDDRDHVALRRGPAGETRYHYDGRDLLVRVDMPVGTWTAEYDALGRRMRKRWGERRVDFHWAGDQLVAESDASGRWRLYLYADALARTPLGFVDYDALDAPPNAGRRHVVFSDPIGTPCLIEDAAQRVVWRADLSPFGAAAVTGEIDFNLRFPGHYLDAELGLHYNRFRYYDPVLGRYLQSDPWGIAGGLNLYGYLTNPLAHADVRGLGGKDEHGTPNDCPHDKEGTEPPTPKKEKTPYPPPRTGQAQAECQHVVDTMAGMGMSKKKNQVVSVLTHDGDRVSVGISGENSTKNQAKATALQNKLNDGHDPPKYRVSTGSPAGIREVEGGNKPGVCGEPHAADSAHGHDRAITGGDTRWRGDDNPHPFTGENADGAPVHPSQMNPCATCGDPHNNDVYGNHANS